MQMIDGICHETLAERKLRLENRITEIEALIVKAQAKVTLMARFARLPLPVQVIMEMDGKDEGVTDLDLVCRIALYLRDTPDAELYGYLHESVDGGLIYAVGTGRDRRYFLADELKDMREALS